MITDAQWYWKSVKDAEDSDFEAWTPYNDKENMLITARFRSGAKFAMINKTQCVDFLKEIQTDSEKPDQTVSIKRVENETSYNTQPEKGSKRTKSNENNNNAPSKTLRSEGCASIHRLKNTAVAKYVKTLNISQGGTILVSHLQEHKLSPKLDLQYGDLVYFEEKLRGTQLYVVTVKDNELALVKTLDEYGIILPTEFRLLPRAYWENDAVISSGFEAEDEGLYDEIYEAPDEEEEQEENLEEENEENPKEEGKESDE